MIHAAGSCAGCLLSVFLAFFREGRGRLFLLVGIFLSLTVWTSSQAEALKDFAMISLDEVED